VNSTQASSRMTINPARMAGFLYLIYIVIHVASDVLGRSKLIVYGNAATTAQNILASE